ncbi:hypothetical protein RchiOBHm_Chr2g0096171 [Rosa chinensis]|uniref:Uncharacterized protein n=1 Tax=Rosa chinensis TaxID=74649 RepID=A0A2P6RL08_ROSCH|nr:hypothetical protein RchiOBHm_Chr2g0096171 [Rosa chinensis]
MAPIWSPPLVKLSPLNSFFSLMKPSPFERQALLFHVQEYELFFQLYTPAHAAQPQLQSSFTF